MNREIGPKAAWLHVALAGAMVVVFVEPFPSDWKDWVLIGALIFMAAATWWRLKKYGVLLKQHTQEENDNERR